MPGGVIFVVYVPTSNYEHMLRSGNKRDLVSLKGTRGSANATEADSGNFMLQVELRNKASRSPSIPVHIAPNLYYSNDAFNPSLENINEDDDVITLEMILQELLPKLGVEAASWRGAGGGPYRPGTGYDRAGPGYDRAGPDRYLQVVFPCPTGPRCETALHCLTKLGIGVTCRSSVNVLPCSVVHSAMDDTEESDEEDLFRRSEQARRWRSFVESIRSKLTVQQVVDGVRGGGELSFDYLTLILTADSLAALGLVENNASNIVAAMLVSPLMGPVMSITFGTIISDKTLVRNGLESLVIGMLASLVFGFIFGLILGTTAMPWGFGDWPTEEMKSRGNARSLWMGVLWALTSGTGVALALLQGSAGPLIGIAISASLLPPVVNCGLYWALACIWLLYPGVKIPHIKGEEYSGNSSYEPLYHEYLPIEFAVNGIVSCCLTIVNVICIFITAIMFLKIKEVAAPYTSTPDLRRFWQRDVGLAREANRAQLRAEHEERTHLVLDELSAGGEAAAAERLQGAVREALDDDTYRKVKRMSYQSHNADEIIRSIGLSSQQSTPPKRASAVPSSAPSPRPSRAPTADDIAVLDRLLTRLLGHGRQPRASGSRQGTPRASRTPYEDLGASQEEPWPDSILENTIVQSVLANLKAQKRSSRSEEDLLLQK